MIRVTADTNIYISGLNFPGGHPFRFLELARTGKILLAVSDPILDEMAEVLQRKFDWPADDIAEARELISSFAQRVAPTETLDAVRDDPDDHRVLECAAAARVDDVVSGDNQLRRRGRTGTGGSGVGDQSMFSVASSARVLCGAARCAK